MHAKAILALLFLVSVAVAGAIFLQALPPGYGARGSSLPPREILVAAVPLAAGTLLRMQDVNWWVPPADASYVGEIRVPTDAERKAKPEIAEDPRVEVRGAALRTNLAAGAPILLGNIVKPADRDFLQVVLSSLSSVARVISIPLPPGSGSLNPGDRVDVILTQTFKGDAPAPRRSVSETVAKDLRVLAIEVAGGKAGSAGSPRSIDLEVSPEQAQTLNVANELGKLSLTLRGGSQADDTAPGGPPPDNANSRKPVWAGDVSPALA
ncbi:MAG: Flp pilus assembly protein CpaB, partial [Stellaceae bacterium]